MPYALSNRHAVLPNTGQRFGTGWLPPMIDRRDYTPDDPKIRPLLETLQRNMSAEQTSALAAPPASVDLRPWCSPIENQQSLGSCTAHAAAGIVEYFERRAFGRHVDGSRLFIYKATRNLIGVTGDTGAWLRNAMGALVLCGVPDERYWPYTDVNPDFDREPSAFVYSVADNFETLKYFAHDPVGANVPTADVLASVKRQLVAGIPSMFGFWGFGSFDYGDQPGHIPLPTPAELQGNPDWGHAIVAVGYDDARRIRSTASGSETTGALLIRNSWGLGWGDAGYGWMPYEYVLRAIAMDFWSLLRMEWASSEAFFA